MKKIIIFMAIIAMFVGCTSTTQCVHPNSTKKSKVIPKSY